MWKLFAVFQIHSGFEQIRIRIQPTFQQIIIFLKQTKLIGYNCLENGMDLYFAEMLDPEKMLYPIRVAAKKAHVYMEKC